MLDTGPWVALIDRSDVAHETCRAFFEECQRQLLSTEAVLTEALHLLSGSAEAQRTCVEYVLRGAVALVPTTIETLRRSIDLVGQYRSVPMDYADATLVVLAEVLDVGDVFTLDRRGFSVYRWKGRRGFGIHPGP